MAFYPSRLSAMPLRTRSQQVFQIDLPTLRDRLAAPLATVTAGEALRLWRWRAIQITAPRPADLQEGPWLANHLRGALGRGLQDRAAQQGGTWESLRRILFETQASLPDFPALATPMAPRASVRHGRLFLEIRLFGRAAAWAGPCAEALTQSLTRYGLVLGERGRSHARLSVPAGAVQISTHEGLPAPRAGPLQISLISPFRRDDRAGAEQIPDLVQSACHARFASLAPWQDLTPAAAPDLPAIVPEGLTLHRVSWTRWSQRQPGRPIPMTGWLGQIFMRATEDQAALLALGAASHAGDNTALGCGEMEQAPYPMDET